MSLIIPFEPSIPFYRFSCPIDDSEYIFDVRWNTRDAAWYFDVSEIDGTPIALGVKVALGAYMGRSVNHKLFRNGVLVADDVSNQRKDAMLDDLGARVLVKWFSLAEIFNIAPVHVS